ncbi:MAG: class I SAM-dependent methyltransferase [Verrucomicrobiota bacterium]
MDKIDDSKSLLETQYKSPKNLSSRVGIHQEFSVNPQSWYHWIFEKLEIPDVATVLELGCGDGGMWLENQSKIQEGWNVCLTDFSPGMLEKAKERLSGVDHSFQFAQVNIEDVPVDLGVFDRVIANHMLYHVPDLERAFSQSRRALSPDGRFIAATNGENHMLELWTLISEFLGTEVSPLNQRFKFNLENGEDLLRPFFSSVRREVFEDALRVTRAEPLLDYFFSSERFYDPIWDQREAFGDFLAQKIERDGVIEIQKSVGVFICQK